MTLFWFLGAPLPFALPPCASALRHPLPPALLESGPASFCRAGVPEYATFGSPSYFIVRNLQLQGVSWLLVVYDRKPCGSHAAVSCGRIIRPHHAAEILQLRPCGRSTAWPQWSNFAAAWTPCGRNFSCGYGYGTFGYGYGRKIVKSWPHGGNAAAISPTDMGAVLSVMASVNADDLCVLTWTSTDIDSDIFNERWFKNGIFKLIPNIDPNTPPLFPFLLRK